MGNALDVILHPDDPDVLGQFTMQITLQKQCWDSAIPRRGYQINEAVLTEKIYTDTGRGRFVAADYAGLPVAEIPEWLARFASRLSFSPSPYPPREQWEASAGMAADALRFWEWKGLFCSGRL